MRHIPKSSRSRTHARTAADRNQTTIGVPTTGPIPDAAATDPPGPKAIDDLDVNPEAYRSNREAFLPDPGEGPARTKDEFAEEFAERFINSATSDEDRDDVRMQEPTIEEEGGPYVTTSDAEEFGGDPDANNPGDTEPEAFPTTQSES